MEPEIHLGPQVMVPDLAGWLRVRMPELPDDAWIALPPDWVCEVLSPSTAQTDRSLKLPVYAKYGIKHCWLLDPVLKTLEAYELVSGKWMLLGTLKENDNVCTPPFEAISFPLGVLWAQ